MRPDAARSIDQWRIKEGRMASSARDGNNGAFLIPFETVTLTVVVSDEDGWDHVSVSLPNRCPRWDEMSFIYSLFFEPHEAAMQLHPPRSEHVNHHPFCLHIWRPHNKRIPLPPSIMVGPKP